MRAQPFARLVRPVECILFLSEADPDEYLTLTHPDEAKDFDTRTAAYLYQALRSSGADIRATARAEDILDHKDEIDYVFSALARYEYPSVDVPVVALCELAGVPCLNGNSFSIAIARDKALCKLTAQRSGLETPDWTTVRLTDPLESLASLSYPRIIKWVTGGNSFSVIENDLAKSAKEAEEITRQWQKAGHTVITEAFVPGTDLIVGVIDQGAKGLTIGKIVQVDTDHPDNIQTHAHKIQGRGKRRRTIVTDKTLVERVHQAVRKLHDQLKPLECYRVDFRWNAEDENLQFLEINPTVNIEPESIFIQSLGSHPKEHTEIILSVLEAGLSRHGLRLPSPKTADPAHGGLGHEAVKENRDGKAGSKVKPIDQTRVLYLAQFSPQTPDAPPAPTTEKWGNIGHFHHALYHALLSLGFKVTALRDPTDILRHRRRADFVFSAFEGATFESSGIVVPALCEAAGLPFIGASARTVAFDVDKQVGKLVAQRLGMATPAWVRIGSSEKPEGLDRLSYPCIAKWQHGGNSKHISPDVLASTPTDAVAKVLEFQRKGMDVLVEEYIPGTNLTTAGACFEDGLHIGTTIQIDTDAPGNIQTFEQKMLGAGKRIKSEFKVTAVLKEIDTFMRRFHVEAAPADMFRVDFRYDPDKESLFFLEANLQCNLDPFGTFCQSIAGGPEGYPDLILKTVTASLQRQGITLVPRQ